MHVGGEGDANASDTVEPAATVDDDVVQMSLHEVLKERDPQFNVTLYGTLTERQKEYVHLASKASPGRSQENYERDSVVKALGGLVGLCFDVLLPVHYSKDCSKKVTEG
jgi:hypothetical protein